MPLNKKLRKTSVNFNVASSYDINKQVSIFLMHFSWGGSLLWLI